jgi:hypothetical protein
MDTSRRLLRRLLLHSAPVRRQIQSAACRSAAPLTYVAWTAGIGLAVTGPLTSIIMAIIVRPMALDHLSSDGLDTLRSRL